MKKLTFSGIIAKAWLIAAIVLIPAQTFGISPADRKAIYNDTVFYEPGGGCTIESSTSLLGSDNPEKAYRYFVQKGLTDQQSAGIIGNLMQESHVNPKSVQRGGPGRGIAQWSVDGRWRVLENFAAREKKDPLDLALQLDFIWHEMNNIAPWKETLPALKASTSIEQATTAFEENYEKAGKPNMQRRIKYANEAFQLYANAGVGVVSSEADCEISGPGEDSKFVDGFLVYNQYDSAWRNKPYGTSTIGRSGCGPAAMAMIITALTGKQVTPVETANYAASRGIYIPGVGTSWSLSSVVAEQWGLKATMVGKDMAKISSTLQTGGLVITSGTGPLPFTSIGHFIVIRGITADGKFKIADSGHSNTSEREWDPQEILATANAGNIYAITK